MSLRSRIRVVLVRPERPVNVGSAARATANMALGGLVIVGDPSILRDEAFHAAKHARDTLLSARFVPSLAEALAPPVTWSLATSARIGTPHRPHPTPVRTALETVVDRLAREPGELALVFGPEGDGLTNDEVACCAELVTVPTPSPYPTLNLAQAVMVLAWEANMACLAREESDDPARADETTRARMISAWVDLAEQVGFVHPGDPRKMRPRLTALFSALSHRPSDVRTLFGLVEQVRRHLRTDGVVDLRAYGRAPGSRHK